MLDGRMSRSAERKRTYAGPVRSQKLSEMLVNPKPSRIGARLVIPTCTKANPFRTSSSDGRPIRPMHDPQCGLVLNRVRGVRVRAMRQNEASKRNGINTLNRESLILNLALGTS